MSTRSHIGRKNEDDSVDYIYCHFDGYLSNNGEILFNHYQDINKVNQLISLGSLSKLGKEIGEKQDFDDYSTQNNDWCLAYGRDRGEDNINAIHKSNIKTAVNDADESYFYFFDVKENRWYVYITESYDSVLYTLESALALDNDNE